MALVVDEVALALTCTRQAAWVTVHTALDLVERVPATLTLLAGGRICPVRARIIAEGTRALSDTDAALVQDEVLPCAEVLTASKLRARVALAVAAVDPRETDEQHEGACAARAVKKYPREHGMTGIWALLPADQAATVWAAVNTHAQASREAGDNRTADQRRADSLTDLMTAYLTGTCATQMPAAGTTTGSRDQDTAYAVAGHTQNDTDPVGRRGCSTPGGHPAPKVPSWCQVQIKISADWLRGRSTEAPVLTGHGPLPTDVALRLIADAGWRRIVYQPQSGALLDDGTTVHDPPAPLRRQSWSATAAAPSRSAATPGLTSTTTCPSRTARPARATSAPAVGMTITSNNTRNGPPAPDPTAGSSGSPPPDTATPNTHPTSDHRTSPDPAPTVTTKPTLPTSTNNPTAAQIRHRSDRLEYVDASYSNDHGLLSPRARSGRRGAPASGSDPHREARATGRVAGLLDAAQREGRAR
ncbi:MAG: DUF222 domain-containing protein [Actinomycetota bacterium]|nr:DUF222 domain-containing protein [Actinomycetota bacterium]